MKKYLLLMAFTAAVNITKAQNVGIGTSLPNAHARLDITDSTGGILIPRLDSLHRMAIPNTQGLLVYETSSNCFWYNDGSAWLRLSTVPRPGAPAEKAALTQLYLIKGF